MNDRISELLAAAVDDGAMPGAVAAAGTRDTVLLERAVGRLSYASDAAPVTHDTIYDLASLTKVIVTTPLVMRLHESGQLDLDAPVNSYLPEFTGSAKDRVTIADLLAHCGGLLWWTDLYRQLPGQPQSRVKRYYLRRICELPLDYEPRTRTVYSDLGFILLGAVLERLSNTPLDRLAAEQIFAPLGMQEIQYNPPAALRNRIAPTEDDPQRGGVLVGHVHDENASRLGGVAPHAGLFATRPQPGSVCADVAGCRHRGRAPCVRQRNRAPLHPPRPTDKRKQPRPGLGYARTRQFLWPSLFPGLPWAHGLYRNLSLDRPGTGSVRNSAHQPCASDPGERQAGGATAVVS